MMKRVRGLRAQKLQFTSKDILDINKIYCGNCIDVLKTFPRKTVDCCIISPPYYGLRDYGLSGQIGNQDTPEQYILNLVSVFEKIKRVFKNDSVLWLNLGDRWLGTGGDRKIHPIIKCLIIYKNRILEREDVKEIRI